MLTLIRNPNTMSKDSFRQVLFLTRDPNPKSEGNSFRQVLTLTLDPNPKSKGTAFVMYSP